MNGSLIKISSDNLMVKQVDLLQYGERTDFTYMDFFDQFLKGKSPDNYYSLRQSLFYGTKFTNCKFKYVEFDNSDFEGVQFENCNFEFCSFKETDLRSLNVMGCRFVETSFYMCLLGDSFVARTKFISCDFSKSTGSNSTFRGCVLDACDFKNSSNTHNTYEDTTFNNIFFYECVNAYHIYNNVNFSGCKSNIESIGQCYGLSRKNLEDMDFVYLSEMQERPGKNSDEIIKAIEDSYLARKWYFQASMIRLCFVHNNRLSGLTEVIEVLALIVRSGAPVKNDDLRLVFRVAQYLADHQAVPFLFLMRTDSLVSDLIGQKNLSAVCTRGLTDLRSNLRIIAGDAINKLEGIIRLVEEIANEHQDVYIKLTYDKKPRFTLRDFLESLALVDGRTPIDMQIVLEQEGSWYQFIKVPAFSFACIIGALHSFNGLANQILDIKITVAAIVHDVPEKIIEEKYKKALSNIRAPSVVQPPKKSKKPDAINHTGRHINDVGHFINDLALVDHKKLTGIKELGEIRSITISDSLTI